MKGVRKINLEKCVIGIELGSTRIKAVLTDEKGKVLASGASEWENRYENGLWTYSEEDVSVNLRACYSALKADVMAKYGEKLTKVGYMGVSAMMHGYIVMDSSDNLLVPFRTWRNNNAEASAIELTKAMGFHIPARWSVAHIYHAVKNGEPHVADIAFQTTLEGYVHYKLTGKKVIGVGEASGMFPITDNAYDIGALAVFDRLTTKYNLPWKLADVLPEILVAGDNAGYLTEAGAKWLDVDGDLLAGVPLCPPEGDAGTGMVATNSVRPRTGNVSAGTSIFGMIVLDRQLEKVYDEIDVVTTPSGDPVAMVHCNNCTSDLNAWVNVFAEFAEAINAPIEKNELFRALFTSAKLADEDAGDVLSYNYVSGENITHVTEGRPMLLRKTESKFNLANFMRSQLYSTMATLKIGLDIMKKENVRIDSLLAHGGLFKSDGPQSYLASALGAPVTVMRTAGEGGAWGMALLSAYALSDRKLSLADWLDDIFKGEESVTVLPDQATTDGMEKFIASYKKGLPVVREAVNALSDNKTHQSTLQALKETVLKANLDLVKNGLVLYTWGNVSAIDRERGLVVIKPSGVDYDGMTAEDMVVVDLDGNVVEGKYRPSSDTPTHIELYKAHPEIGGVVHTHSTYATARAQSGKPLTAYGTTHADYFYGDVPCTRALTKEEIDEAYEKNTGLVINETIGDKDALAVPAILVKNHGPFAWGKDADDAVYHATVLEEVAKMASITESFNKEVNRADDYLLDKHYNRKHGKNAYYGQK